MRLHRLGLADGAECQFNGEAVGILMHRIWQCHVLYELRHEGVPRDISLEPDRSAGGDSVATSQWSGILFPSIAHELLARPEEIVTASRILLRPLRDVRWDMRGLLGSGSQDHH